VSLKTVLANRMAFRQWHAQGPLVTAFLAVLALTAGSAANAADPPSWYVLPDVTAFHLAQQAATRSTFTAQIDASTSTTIEAAGVQTVEWWTVNRPFAKELMDIPTNQVQGFPVYCTRTTNTDVVERCFGPFPAKLRKGGPING
jgi:hypothetical protein